METSARTSEIWKKGKGARRDGDKSSSNRKGRQDTSKIEKRDGEAPEKCKSQGCMAQGKKKQDGSAETEKKPQ